MFIKAFLILRAILRNVAENNEEFQLIFLTYKFNKETVYK